MVPPPPFISGRGDKAFSITSHKTLIIIIFFLLPVTLTKSKAKKHFPRSVGFTVDSGRKHYDPLPKTSEEWGVRLNPQPAMA